LMEWKAEEGKEGRENGPFLSKKGNAGPTEEKEAAGSNRKGDFLWEGTKLRGTVILGRN